MSTGLTNDWPQALLDRDQQEKDIVRQLGDRMGYGRIMQLCEEIWHEKEIAAGREHASGAFVHGLFTISQRNKPDPESKTDKQQAAPLEYPPAS